MLPHQAGRERGRRAGGGGRVSGTQDRNIREEKRGTGIEKKGMKGCYGDVGDDGEASKAP